MKVCLFGDARSIHVRRLVRGLIKQGASVHVVTHKPSEIAGATVERFDVPSPGLTNPRRWAGRHQRYLRGFVERYDVVSIQFLADWGFSADWFDRGCVVATAWGSDIVDPPGEGVADPALVETRRMMLRHAAAVTTCGPTFADVVATYAGIDRSRIDVLPFGVDLRLFDRSRFADSTQYGAGSKCSGGSGTGCATAKNDGSPVVGYYKGFRPVYGPTTLMHAVPLVLERVPDVRFELVGDGMELERCQTMAQEAGLGRSVTFAPRREHDEIPSLLARWNLSVIPSVHEAFGVAALESSTMGVPVVATDVCGLRDTIIDGRTGRLVPPNDPLALAQAIVALLSNPTQLRLMGIAGRAFVAEHFDADVVHRRWFEYFRQVRERRCVMV